MVDPWNAPPAAALREVLEKRGVLGALRARVRAEVFEALEEGETAGGGGRPAPCRENLVLNELIREYLVYNNYNYTASVLLQGGVGGAVR